MIHIVKDDLDTLFVSDNTTVAAVKGRQGYNDLFEELESGVFRWTRTGAPSMRMDLTILTAYRADFYMVPGVNYNGNGFGTFCEYYTDRYKGIPWVYSSNRQSVPAMTMSQGKIGESEFSCSLFGIANDGNSCSIYEENGITVQKIIWPEEESPKLLNLYRYDAPYYAEPKEKSVFTAYLVIEEKPSRKAGYRKALDIALKNGSAEKTVEVPCSMEQLYEMSIAYANTLYTEEKSGFKGFYIGLCYNGGEWKKSSNYGYEIGWGGQNALLANSLIRYSIAEPDDTSSRERGFAVLDSWIEYCHLPIGVIHAFYDPEHKRYLEACDLGSAGVEYFEASHLAEQLGDAERSEKYFKTALEICDFALQCQGENGEFAKCWDENGNPAICEGTTGAFITLPLLRAYSVTGERKYLEAAEKALNYYMNEFYSYGFTTAGALDIFSIDKESAIPLLKGSLMLYDITGERRWLNAALDAAWYLSTWQCCSTEHFDTDTIMGQTGYDTYGGTLVSTTHQGMDSFANSYVPELYHLYRITGEQRWYDRAKAIWQNGCQHISDETLTINGIVRPVGSQDEYYETTRQSLDGKRNSKPGTSSGWLVAWPCSFRLDVIDKLRDIPEAEDFFQITS